MSHLQTLTAQKKLSHEQIAAFIELAEQGKMNLSQQAAILSGLNVKGITDQELAGFAKILLKKMPETVDFPGAIDICGTGGSGLPRINTSTISAFVLSALGVSIAKHGNRAASGRFGSFDLLQQMGVKVDLSLQHLEQLGKQLHLNFLYARQFHPTMRHFAQVRQEIAFPTVFNLLGPLLNPAAPTMQIIGTPFRHQMKLIAETAKRLGKKHVMVVCGEDGLDEVTLSGKTFVIELNRGKIRSFTLTHAAFGITSARFEEIAGGNAKRNTDIALEILEGKSKSRHLDLVLVNCALALKLSGRVSNLKKAYQLAKECIISGKAYRQFLAYKKASHAPSVLLEIAHNTQKEVSQRKRKLPLKKFLKKLRPSDRDFRSAILGTSTTLIAEIKRSSPSEGVLRNGKFDVGGIAKTYEASGAKAISVLTDKKFFGGDLGNLRKAQAATKHTPLLRKDFIIDEYQIYEARHFGADAILLIAALLTPEVMNQFIGIAKSLNMQALVEVHTEAELKEVLTTNAEIIGINNRDLHTFKTDLKTTDQLCKKIPQNKIVVAESGINSRQQLLRLPKKVRSVLVGTSLMKSENIQKKVFELIGKPKPLVKICGVQTIQEALLAQKYGADFVGLNFVPSSSRRISYQIGANIAKALHQRGGTKVVGVFRNQSLEEVNRSAQSVGLDSIQLSGDEPPAYVKKCSKPVIKGISMIRKSSINKVKRYLGKAHLVLLDGKDPGSGTAFDHRALRKLKVPFLLAGGMSPENVRQVLKEVQPVGVDVASGVENNGKRDLKKIRLFLQRARS